MTRSTEPAAAEQPEERLEAIEAKQRKLTRGNPPPRIMRTLLRKDVPWLIAEVRRLRGAAREERPSEEACKKRVWDGHGGDRTSCDRPLPCDLHPPKVEPPAQEQGWRMLGCVCWTERRKTTPSWPPTLPPGALVHCDGCDTKHPGLIVDNDATSVDMLCGHCRLVLLTLFRAAHPATAE